MRTSLVSSFAALLLLAFMSSARAEDAAKSADGISWRTSYATATKEAEDGGKPLLFDFYTGWCPHCTHMDKTTWIDPGVAKLTSSFIPAKVNADLDKVPVSRYRLTGFPTVIVAEPGGDEVLRLAGFHDANDISAALKSYLASADSLKGAFATLRKDDSDPAANITVGAFFATASAPDEAADHFQKALKKAQGEQLVTAAAGAGTALNATGKFKQAAKLLDATLGKAGVTPSAPLLLARAEAAKGLGDAASAKDWYQRVVKEHAGTPEAQAASTALGSP